MRITRADIRSRGFAKALGAVAAAATLATSPAPAMAQDGVSEARLRKIEAEIRALQRNVFPGGDGRFFEPQIASTPETQPQTTTNAPSTTALTDVLARLDALEQQLQRLTAMTEENANALSQFESRIEALEARPVPTPEPLPDVGLTEDGDGDEASVTESNLSAMTDGASSGEEPQAARSGEASSGPSAARLAAVQEIAKPQTGDAADDEYSYGFRLWNAGFYPEARQQLSNFVEQYPDHWRVTFGRNLLGRAFLDDGMAEEAARWFLRNYQADRTAARAPDSLLYLAESMIAMNDTRRACIALAEFGETYPAVASGRLLDQYEANRQKVSCET